MYYMYLIIKKQYALNVSSRNYTAKKQLTLLKITDNEKWNFLALLSIPTDAGHLRPTKSFSRLMYGISSENHGDFYCYGCFHSFRTESVLNKHNKYNKFYILLIL